MQTTTLGSLTVSRLCLGTMLMGGATPASEAHQMLDRFLGAGGTFIDTADVYGDGESERTLAPWLVRHRERVVLAAEHRLCLWIRWRATTARRQARADVSKTPGVGQNCFAFRRSRAIRSARSSRIDRTIGPIGQAPNYELALRQGQYADRPCRSGSTRSTLSRRDNQRQHPRLESRHGNLASVFRGAARATARNYRQRGCLRGMRQDV